MIRTTITTALAVLAITLTASALEAAPPDRPAFPDELPILVLDITDTALPATPAPTIVQPVIIQAPLTPEAFAAQGLKWVQAIATVLGAITMVLIPVVAVLWTRVRDVTKRQDRQAEKQGQIDGAVRQALAAAPPTVITPPGTSSSSTTAPLILLALLPAFAFMGCATTGPNAARNAGINAAGSQALAIAGKVLGKAVVQGLISATQQEVSGGKVDFAQAAAKGLWANVDAAETFQDVQSIAMAYSAGKARALANQAAHAYDVAIMNGVEPSTALGQIAAVISTTTGAPPAK